MPVRKREYRGYLIYVIHRLEKCTKLPGYASLKRYPINCIDLFYGKRDTVCCEY